MPAKAGIQYAGKSGFTQKRGVLDYPPSRMMTSTIVVA
jgi:hypothetical protein